jgi:GT2 family glycosyltransferase
MEKDKNVVSVIIPTIGRTSIIGTKTALKNQTRIPDEIIIIEDANQRGPSWARNEGMKKAKGNLIAFTDDDCIPGNDWIEKFIKTIEVYNASMVSSDFIETDPFLDEIRQRRNFPDSVRINPEGFVGNTGNVMYRKECLDECIRLDGFIFNPIFGAFASEDIDLVFRLKKRGHTLVYINNKVNHLKKMPLLHYLKHQFYRGIGLGVLFQIHKKTDEKDLPDQSLLWKRRENSVLKFILLLWKKILGPFDYQSFSKKLYFITFWVGEKAQALGFTMCLIFKRIE